MTAIRSMKPFLGCLVLAGALLVWPPSADAAEDGGSRPVLAYGAGNRALALGGAYAAVANDASAPLWNPGGLGLVQRREFQVSRTSMYGLGISEEFAGFVLPNWRLGTVAATLRHFGVSGIDGRDDRNVATGEDLSDSETQITLSFGRTIGEAWSVGATVKFQQQSLAGLSATGVGIDIGLILNPGVAIGTTSQDHWSRNLALGLVLQNVIEPSLRLDQESVADPLVARLGFSYRHIFGGAHHVLAVLDLERSPDMDPRIHAGLEVRIHSLLALRTGFNHGTFTVGTGVQWRDLAFDYTLENQDLGALHRLGLSLAFGASVQESRLAALKSEEEALQGRLSEAFETRQAERSRSLMDQAESALADTRYDDALEILSVVSVLSPDEVELSDLKVRCLLEKARDIEAHSNFAEAVVAYRQVLSITSDHTEASDALERCRKEGDRRAKRSTIIRAQFSQALDAFSSGDLVAARDLFSSILELQPEDEEAAAMLRHTELAIEHRVVELLEQADRFRRAELFTEAKQLLVMAQQFIPGASSIRRAEAELEQARLKTGTARPIGSESISSPPTDSAKRTLSPKERKETENLYRNGVEAMEAGRNSDALRYWELVFSADPDFMEVREYLKREYLLQGMDAYTAGKLDDALGLWESALRIDPGDETAVGYVERARQQISRTHEIIGTTGR